MRWGACLAWPGPNFANLAFAVFLRQFLFRSYLSSEWSPDDLLPFPLSLACPGPEFWLLTLSHMGSAVHGQLSQHSLSYPVACLYPISVSSALWKPFCNLWLPLHAGFPPGRQGALAGRERALKSKDLASSPSSAMSCVTLD